MVVVGGEVWGSASFRVAVWFGVARRVYTTTPPRSAAINICGELLLVGYVVRHFDLQANRAATLIIYLVACYDAPFHLFYTVDILYYMTRELQRTNE